VLYLSVPPPASKYQAMKEAGIGLMMTPERRSRDVVKQVSYWAADNGCFSQGDAFSLDAYLAWLGRMTPAGDTCLFAVAPDVLCNAGATWERSAPVLPKLRALGYRAALVAQNGMEDLAVDWNCFDVLFLGGDTVWKLGEAAQLLAGEAKSRGKWLHMGRVNSRRRLEAAQMFGCDSADGTMIAFKPDERLEQVTRWLDGVRRQPSLWGAA
jgi:hypothetical protein